MTSLHTPGPWEQCSGKIFGPTGNAIATVHKHQSPTVTIDNARLIAAAPALLVALHAALDAVDAERAEGIEPPDWYGLARAAIASTVEA